MPYVFQSGYHHPVMSVTVMSSGYHHPVMSVIVMSSGYHHPVMSCIMTSQRAQHTKILSHERERFLVLQQLDIGAVPNTSSCKSAYRSSRMRCLHCCICDHHTRYQKKGMGEFVQESLHCHYLL